MARSRGFTLIELMVVVAIISILAGMVLAGLGVLRRQQKIASTLDLMTHLTTAVDKYLSEWPRLGCEGTVNDSSDFIADPWEFLFKRYHRAGKVPLIEVPLSRLVTKIGAGACTKPEAVQTATHIADHFGNTPVNVLSWTIVNHNRGSGRSFLYTQAIILRSSAGTNGDPKDDLVFFWSSDKASWRQVKTKDLEALGEDLDPKATPKFSDKWVDPLDG
jgi:prepilin-type N-terminal cleavage/methylation domain-containing protein